GAPTGRGHDPQEEAFWKEALGAFHKEFDRLKTEGEVRDTLEVVIEGRDAPFFAGAEDWFVVSDVSRVPSDGPALVAFEVDGHPFGVVKSTDGKCARCWKRRAGETGGNPDLCRRCLTVLEEAEGKPGSLG